MNPETSQIAAADRARLLEQRFQHAGAELAPCGFVDRYAGVYQGSRCLGLVAVDAARRVWYAAAAAGRDALVTKLRASGFRHCTTNSLAALYFHLVAKPQAPFAPAAEPAAAPVPATLPFRVRHEAPALLDLELDTFAA